MKSKFYVKELIELNGEIKQELYAEFNTYSKSYEYVSIKIARYLENIMQTMEIDNFFIKGNGTEFVIENSYYVDSKLQNERIVLQIVENEQ